METGIITLPLISIIIPAYNAEKYIEVTVQSVLNQTYTNIEIIVVNDGSTDSTGKVLEAITEKYRSIKLIDQKNTGAAAARNIGYRNSNGELVKFLDGDDIINIEMIECQVSLALKNPDHIISSQWGRFHNNDIKTFNINPEECWNNLSALDWICSSWKNAQSMTNPGIFLIPKMIIEKASLWDESLSLFDDMEYFTRTILNSKGIVFCDKCTLYYRSGIAESLSGVINEKSATSGYKAVLNSIKHLMSKENSERTRLLSANSLQQLLYYYYPYYPKITSSLQKEIKSLGGSNLRWPSSETSHFISNVLGWKLTKKIQLAKQKL